MLVKFGGGGGGGASQKIIMRLALRDRAQLKKIQ